MKRVCGLKRVFITGSAGFIGFHLAKLLLQEGFRVHGLDGMTPYYDVGLKRARHDQLLAMENFTASEGLIEDEEKVARENELKNLRRKINKLQNKSQEELKELKGLRSEKDRISREKLQALKKRDVELKKAADAKKLADDESKRLLKATRLREEAELKKELAEKEVANAERVLAETELQAEIKSEEVLEELSEQRVRDAKLIDRYAAAIKSRVLENYTVLPGHEGLACTLRINLIRDGHVAGVEVIKSSNNPSFDRLAETAVRKVVPLPVPDDDRIFDKMKVISFVFKPPRP